MLQAFLHLILHILVPAAAARFFWSERWKSPWLLMVLAMIIDADHLLADPVYDPYRCSLGFHPLHSWPAAAGYGLLLLVPAARIAATGLLIHLGVDGVDCLRIAAQSAR
jgi:hypothetical protein